VVKKKLRQWYLRITEYADRLLSGLETIEFSEAMKEMQTNWIGKSFGAEIDFVVNTSTNSPTDILTTHTHVYTTRPDTIFGVDFMVVAPEHELIPQITTAENRKQLLKTYITYVKSRSDRERQAEKKISGCFTGAYAINPFNGKQIPIWISEYVLAGYGTGAIMGVPCGDERDHKFANHFNIPITNIIGEHYDGKEANPTKDAKLQNSGFIDGMVMRDAIAVVNRKLQDLGIGKEKVNYKMRDAAFSRQRYWGEPFPIQWKNGVAIPLSETELPLLLPEVDSYSPGPEGEGPLANIPEWVAKELETNTMPGYAGSSWYFLRYMDPHNNETFCDRKVSDYWNQVDLYIGGTEHAVGHLLYSRMWTKALYDLGHIGFDEPFRKLLNQGMIQGSSDLCIV
jgi:leucyl-tRNA synthetase